MKEEIKTAQQFVEQVSKEIERNDRELTRLAGKVGRTKELHDLYVKIWEIIQRVEEEEKEKIINTNYENAENHEIVRYQFNDGSTLKIDLDLISEFGKDVAEINFYYDVEDGEGWQYFKWDIDYLEECDVCKKDINTEEEEYVKNEEGTFHIQCYLEKLTTDLTGEEINGREVQAFSTEATLNDDDLIYVVVEMNEKYKEDEEDETIKSDVKTEVGRGNWEILPKRGIYFTVNHRGRTAKEILGELKEILRSGKIPKHHFID